MRILTPVLLCALAYPFSSSATEPDAGAQLFLEGEGAMALLAGGEVKVDASSGFACADCHGGDALGRREGGTRFPAIVWSALADPARAEGSYDIDSFMRAVREGVGVDGRQLSAAMPRYEVQSAQLESLVEFLSRLDSQERRGVSTTSIAIGFPEDPDEYQQFNRALSEANATGGIWGRRLTRAQGDAGLFGWQELQKRLAEGHDSKYAQLISEPALRAYVIGTTLVDVIMDCGRAVTRSCVQERLDNKAGDAR